MTEDITQLGPFVGKPSRKIRKEVSPSAAILASMLVYVNILAQLLTFYSF